jgi:hypothetical protein
MSKQAKFSIVIFLVLLALLSCFYLINTAHAPTVNTTTSVPATKPQHSETTQSITSQSNNSGTAVGGK